MRIHLLEHDPTEGQVTNIDRWAQTNGHALTRTLIFEQAVFPDPADYDWLLVMGGSQHAWEEEIHPWLAPEKEYLTRVLARNTRVAGICLGAQLLAEVLGGQVHPNPEEEIGWFEVTLNRAGRNCYLFEGVPDIFPAFHWHVDHFSLPPGTLNLAFSPPTPHQAFIIPEKPVVGLQFHPEYTPEMVRYFAAHYGHAWRAATWVEGRSASVTRAAELGDTYWLMEKIMENLTRRWG